MPSLNHKLARKRSYQTQFHKAKQHIPTSVIDFFQDAIFRPPDNQEGLISDTVPQDNNNAHLRLSLPCHGIFRPPDNQELRAHVRHSSTRQHQRTPTPIIAMPWHLQTTRQPGRAHIRHSSTRQDTPRSNVDFFQEAMPSSDHKTARRTHT